MIRIHIQKVDHSEWGKYEMNTWNAKMLHGEYIIIKIWRFKCLLFICFVMEMQAPGFAQSDN